ncbi:unnamed protein product [Ixodes pacificus]
MATGHQAAQQPMPLNPFVVELPEKLNFRRPEDEALVHPMGEERYRIISGLKKQDGVTQVNTLVYAIGHEAEDVPTSLTLTDAKNTTSADILSLGRMSFTNVQNSTGMCRRRTKRSTPF